MISMYMERRRFDREKKKKNVQNVGLSSTREPHTVIEIYSPQLLYIYYFRHDFSHRIWVSLSDR